jgi:DNA-binding CsgD family transcriptional regulator
MIYELVAHPAKKIDLTDAEREVARILAARRAADAAAEETP